MSVRDPEIIDIQETWFRDNRENKRWIIVEVSGGYEMHIHDRDNVSPVVTYPTKRGVAARLLQLLNSGPVAPQIYAEEIEIGSVVLDEPRHKSDCAVHNAPAFEPGPCDCGALKET